MRQECHPLTGNCTQGSTMYCQENTKGGSLCHLKAELSNSQRNTLKTGVAQMTATAARASLARQRICWFKPGDPIWSEVSSKICLLWESEFVQPLWRTEWSLLKKKKKLKLELLMWSSNPTLRHISRKDESSNSKRYKPPMSITALSNGQDIEAT